MMPLFIVSGGQTGADQGGLVAAKQLGIKTAGYMPFGFKTEDGPCPAVATEYGLREDVSPLYPPRTRRNAKMSDGTAWFGTVGSPGYRCTRNACVQYNKPFRVIESAKELRDFVSEHNITVLNVAGNRESKNKGIYRKTAEIILEAFRHV